MTLSDEQIEHFQREGYCTTGVLFDAQTLEELKSEFDRVWQEEINAAAQLDEQSAELVRLRPFVGGLHGKSEVCARFCLHPVFQEISRALVGPDVDVYCNQAVMKAPGKGKAFGWHQDSRYNTPEPLEYITCWLAVSDATIENGTIEIAPGQHQAGLLPHDWSEDGKEWRCQFDESNKTPVELRAGQMAIFSSLLPHGSGPNITDATRYAYVVQYHVARVRRKSDGELSGDQFPVLRDGLPVASLVSA